jgi:hypothetical protein
MSKNQLWLFRQQKSRVLHLEAYETDHESDFNESSQIRSMFELPLKEKVDRKLLNDFFLKDFKPKVVKKE